MGVVNKLAAKMPLPRMVQVEQHFDRTAVTDIDGGVEKALADEGVLEAMDGSESQRFLPVKRGKDGSLGGDVAAPGQLAMLKKYVMETLAKLVDGIAGGQVEPNPYVRGDHEACRFCDYGGACHLDLWGEPRVFRAVTGPEFWQQVEKEEIHGK